jgi:exonuclease III
MTKVLKHAVWNASGLCQNAQEVRLFIQSLDLDILFVSETHFTERNHMTIPNYKIHHTAHPDATAHGGKAVIIRQNLKHHVRAEYRHEHIQATNIAVEDNIGELKTLLSIVPPSTTSNTTSMSAFSRRLGTDS